MKENYKKIRLFTTVLTTTAILLSGCDQDQISYDAQKNTSSIVMEPAVVSYDTVKTFSYDLFSQNMHSQNPVLSPISAYLALSMAGSGSGSTTKEAFVDLLGENMTSTSNSIIHLLSQNNSDNVISLANSIWIDDSCSVKTNWLDNIQSVMNVEAFKADLSSAQITQKMNQWIQEQTNGMIDNMIYDPFPADTKVVLFDTIYFKAKWKTAFDPSKTYEDTFFLENGEQLLTKTMHLYTSDLDYLSTDFAEGLLLPYQDTDASSSLAFLVLKPTDEKYTIREIYEKLTEKVISDMLDNRKTMLVNTKLPTFAITFDQSLNDSLQHMGLEEAFDPSQADFSNLSHSKLYISLVRQKAKIIVSEEETEAAAVTEVAMSGGGELVPAESITNVYFDRPFLYIILDLEQELPLFIGILDNPQSIEP